MLPIELREFPDEQGRSPFKRWIRLWTIIPQHAYTNIGKGVSELRVEFGPGYRIYFGWGGRSIVVLLGGGSKKRQQDDIASAQLRWSIYKRGV